MIKACFFTKKETYARVNYKESMNISDMARHMAEHNTAFSEGLILDFI